MHRLYFQPPAAVVEALAASWIEILMLTLMETICAVEALAASWIEIATSLLVYIPFIVEALAASWIEIIYLQLLGA